MNDEHFVLYALEEGGLWRARRATREEYESTMTSGKLREDEPWRGPGIYTEVKPTFVAFGKILENHDFVLGRSRG